MAQMRKPGLIRRDGRSLDRTELQWVIERAASLAADDDDAYTWDEAVSLGRELGLSDATMLEALRQLDRTPRPRPAGPGEVVAYHAVPLPARAVVPRIERELEKRLMERCPLHPAGCWAQRRDWWPDLQRLGSEVHVQIQVRSRAVDATHVELRVDLRRAALGYAGAAGAGSAAMWLVLGPAGLLPAVVSWVAISASAVSAYRRRAMAIRIRLEELLAALGSVT